MDRRDFLSISAGTSAGVALAGAGAVFVSASNETDTLKRGGRAFNAQPVAAQSQFGSLPFALSFFADGEKMIDTTKRSPVDGLSVLSPLRDVSFHGFAGGSGALAGDELHVVAVHRARDGTIVRHDLWSHLPKRMGGSSQSVLFTAHDNAFSGFEVTHIPASGARSSAYFSFMASGSGPQFKPGIYVLAGPSAATGQPPDLGRYANSGNLRAPVRESRLLGLDFPYLSFAVYGEWV